MMKLWKAEEESRPLQQRGVVKRAPLRRPSTVRNRSIETGISEAIKRVPIFSFATQGGK